MVNYLLTPESFKQKLLSKEFQQDVSVYLENELGNALHTEKTINDLLKSWGKLDGQEDLQLKIDGFIGKKYDQWMEEYRHQKLRELLPNPLKKRSRKSFRL